MLMYPIVLLIYYDTGCVRGCRTCMLYSLGFGLVVLLQALSVT